MRAVDELLEDDELLDTVYDVKASDISKVERAGGTRHRRRWFCAC